MDLLSAIAGCAHTRDMEVLRLHIMLVRGDLRLSTSPSRIFYRTSEVLGGAKCPLFNDFLWHDKSVTYGLDSFLEIIVEITNF